MIQYISKIERVSFSEKVYLAEYI